MLDNFATLAIHDLFAMTFIASKYLSDVFERYREKRGYVLRFDRGQLTDEQIYRMALGFKTDGTNKPGLPEVWEQYPDISKRQAYNVLDTWTEIHRG